MQLTQEDKALLLSWGYEERDIRQIENAIHSSKTIYYLEGVRIGRAEAIHLLGIRKYLAGISRSAFHWSAVQETGDGRIVHFDSSRLFK